MSDPYRTSVGPAAKKRDWWDRNGFQAMALVILFGMASGAVRSSIQWSHDELVCPSESGSRQAPEPTALAQECDTVCAGLGLRQVAHEREYWTGRDGYRCTCIEARRSCAWHSTGEMRCWSVP